VRYQANVRIIRPRSGRGQQNQGRDEPGGLVRPPDQFAPDPLALVVSIHREVGKIRAIGEVGHRPSDADESSVDPGCE
jgi:hypothetical protein